MMFYLSIMVINKNNNATGRRRGCTYIMHLTGR